MVLLPDKNDFSFTEPPEIPLYFKETPQYLTLAQNCSSRQKAEAFVFECLTAKPDIYHHVSES